MSRSRFLALVVVVAVCTIGGLFLGSVHLRAPAAQAKSVSLAGRVHILELQVKQLRARLQQQLGQTGPVSLDGRIRVLAMRVADLKRRVKPLERELKAIPPPWCGISILYDYVAALRATVVEGADPPPAKPGLCL